MPPGVLLADCHTTPFEPFYTTYVCPRLESGGVAASQRTAEKSKRLEREQRATTRLVMRPQGSALKIGYNWLSYFLRLNAVLEETSLTCDGSESELQAKFLLRGCNRTRRHVFAPKSWRRRDCRESITFPVERQNFRTRYRQRMRQKMTITILS